MKKVLLFSVIFLLSSCFYAHNYDNFYDTKHSGHYKIGKSYTIKGITYTPQHYDSYEEIGIASWYGSDFHNKLTANGDKFNRNLITAAHKTLPLPCFVEVTNLENGKSLIVKVNDRGPFVKNRLIDLSEKAAEILGFHHKGLASVRVRYLKEISQNLVNKNPSYRKQYEKAVEEYRRDKLITSMNIGYVAKFKNVVHAKNIVSKLRNQGFKNARFVFKDGEYYIHMS